MKEDYDAALDGNAAAGDLAEIFSELTTASGKCIACGKIAMLAQDRAYMNAPGVVIRCIGCGGVLVRYVKSSGRAWLDMRGLAYLLVGMPQS